MANVGGLPALPLSPDSAVAVVSPDGGLALSLLHAATASSGRRSARIEGRTVDGMRFMDPFMDHSLGGTGFPGRERTRTAARRTSQALRSARNPRSAAGPRLARA